MGLDEVADISKRQEVVNEIVNGVNRLEAIAASLQVVVTSRPAAFANSPGPPSDKFPYYQLDSVTRPLINDYANKWIKARKLDSREAWEVKMIIREKLDQPHLRDLAKNPMQLTILLSLIRSQGLSLPEKRTALYDDYIKHFLIVRQLRHQQCVTTANCSSTFKDILPGYSIRKLNKEAMVAYRRRDSISFFPSIFLMKVMLYRC
jgi:hypothetical protein